MAKGFIKCKFCWQQWIPVPNVRQHCYCGAPIPRENSPYPELQKFLDEKGWEILKGRGRNNLLTDDELDEFFGFMRGLTMRIMEEEKEKKKVDE